MKEFERVLRSVGFGDTVELVRNGKTYHFTRNSKRWCTFTVMVDGQLIEKRPLLQPKVIVSWLMDGEI